MSGQFEEIELIIRTNLLNKNYDTNAVRELLNLAKLSVFSELERGASYGINGTCDASQVAYEVRSVIRRYLAYERNPKGGFTVDFDPPLKVSQDPLPEFRRVQESVSPIPISEPRNL